MISVTPHSSKTFFRVAVLTSLMLCTSSFAMAQNIPSSADVGRVIQDLEAPDRAPAQMGNIITFSDKDSNREQFSDEKLFTLSKVVLDGSSVYSQDEINRFLKKFYNQETSFRDLNDINRALTKKYRDDGYIFSRTELSPQKIKDGVVRINVLEGRIGNVTVTGNYKDPTNLIQTLANKIKSSGPANTNTLERYLLLINDIPGITAKSILEPSATSGAGDVIINVEQDLVEGSLSIDNRGSGYLGRARATAVGTVNSLFTVDDRTTLRGILSGDREELKFGDLTHERQIGSEGTSVKLRLAKTATEPGKELKVFPVEGESNLLDLEVAHPFLRSRQYNVNFYAGFNGTNSETDVATLNVAKDKVRSVRLGSRADFSDELAGINAFDLTFTKGVDWFGATENGAGRSKANGDQEFFKTNLTASRLQSLGNGFSLNASASGQYSSDALLSSEEFSVGGSDFGRAFDSGEIAGDKGVSGALELRYGAASSLEFVEAYEVYGFYDIGKVWNKDLLVTEVASQSLASAGVGTRLNLAYDVSGNVELSKPLTKTVSAENDDDTRLFFSLTKRF